MKAANQTCVAYVALIAFVTGCGDCGKSNHVHSESQQNVKSADVVSEDATIRPEPKSEERLPHELLSRGLEAAAIRVLEANPKLISGTDSDDCTPLHVAAQNNRLEATRWLLEHGADVNARAYNGFTPLHLADEFEMVELLLTRSPNLALQCRISNETPLQRASREAAEAEDPATKQRWLRIADRLLVTGASYDPISAIERNDVARLRAVLRKSPKYADNFQDGSLLRVAAGLGHHEICELLIREFHVDVNDFERGVGYPIIKEALGHPKVVKLLIENGADLKTPITWKGGRTGIWIIRDNATLLHYAASDGVPETITLLIEHGVDILATTRDDFDQSADEQTALDVAAFFGRAENAVAILTHPKFKQAPQDIRQKLLDRCLAIGAFPSWLAFKAKRPELIRALVQHGANPNTKLNGLTPIMIAAECIHPTHDKENDEIKANIRFLREHGATLDFVSAVAIGDVTEVRKQLAADPKLAATRNSKGCPALHLAVSMDFREIVDLMLKAGCDVNILDNTETFEGTDNGSALHAAAFWNREEIAQTLIAAGATINAHDNQQATPLDEAIRRKNEKLIALLKKHGGVRNKSDEDE